jgi:4-hydroxy-tetrahydrodipicolinate synthase
MLAGADGVISVASNVLPATMRRLCDFARAGNAQAANELDAQLQAIFDFLGVEPNPIPLKAILQSQGLGHGLRLPLLPLPASHAVAATTIAATVRELETACANAA